MAFQDEWMLHVDSNDDYFGKLFHNLYMCTFLDAD